MGRLSDVIRHGSMPARSPEAIRNAAHNTFDGVPDGGSGRPGGGLSRAVLIFHWKLCANNGHGITTYTGASRILEYFNLDRFQPLGNDETEPVRIADM